MDSLLQNRTRQVQAPGDLCLWLRRWIVGLAAICLVAGLHAHAQERPAPPARPNPFPVERTGTRPQPVPQPAPVVPARFHEDSIPPTSLTTSSSFTDPATVGTSLKVLVAVTILGLVPSILLMTTCFVRFTVVLGLLRQAMGTPQALPNQILTALGMFMTFLVMAPVWQRSYDEGIRPYTNPTSGSQPIDEALAFQRSAAPLRDFMARQIDQAGNADAVWMLIDYQRPEPTSPRAATWHEPQNYDDVPLTVLAPAYLLSELKVAFLIGFQIFLPFLVIDLVVASILTSLGLNMLPPSMISLPFKLLLFVLIDGWFLTVGMLLESVRLA